MAEVSMDEVKLFNSEWVDLDTKFDFSGDHDAFGAFDEPARDMADKEIERRFTYHPPKDGQVELYEAIRHVARDMAICIRDLCPECREKDEAIDALDVVVMLANAAIARS